MQEQVAMWTQSVLLGQEEEEGGEEEGNQRQHVTCALLCTLIEDVHSDES